MAQKRAVYLGGGGVPYTTFEGSAEQIKQQAIQKGINPVNLFGEGFKSVGEVDYQPALDYLFPQQTKPTTQQIQQPTQQQPTGQGKYFAWAQTPDNRILSMQGEQKAVLADIEKSGWKLSQGQAQTAKYGKEGQFLGWEGGFPSKPNV